MAAMSHDLGTDLDELRLPLGNVRSNHDSVAKL
jgi:hypothetical protein